MRTKIKQVFGKQEMQYLFTRSPPKSFFVQAGQLNLICGQGRLWWWSIKQRIQMHIFRQALSWPSSFHSSIMNEGYRTTYKNDALRTKVRLSSEVNALLLLCSEMQFFLTCRWCWQQASGHPSSKPALPHKPLQCQVSLRWGGAGGLKCIHGGLPPTVKLAPVNLCFLGAASITQDRELTQEGDREI